MDILDEKIFVKKIGGLKMVETIVMKDIKDLKAIKGSGTDLTEFEGARVKIADTAIVEVKSQFIKTGTQKCLKVVTEVVTTVEDKEGKKYDITASELFNLSLDKEGSLGWSDSAQGSLNKFLNKMKCKTPSDLFGKLVTVRCYEREDANKGKRTYLGFVKE